MKVDDRVCSEKKLQREDSSVSKEYEGMQSPIPWYAAKKRDLTTLDIVVDLGLVFRLGVIVCYHDGSAIEETLCSRFSALRSI